MKDVAACDASGVSGRRYYPRVSNGEPNLGCAELPSSERVEGGGTREVKHLSTRRKIFREWQWQAEAKPDA